MKKLISLILSLAFITGLCVPVNAGDIYRCGSGEKKKVALTFDDGPHPVYTPKILEILQKYSVKATFFMIGKSAAEHPDIVKKVQSSGHTVANHTYSHKVMGKISYSELCREVDMGSEEIKKLTGKAPDFFRPPGGFHNEMVEKVSKSRDLPIILWTIDTRDWTCPGVRHIIKSVKEGLCPGAIILFHDYVSGKSSTPEALETLIPYILSEGYRIVSLGELLEL